MRPGTSSWCGRATGRTGAATVSSRSATTPRVRRAAPSSRSTPTRPAVSSPRRRWPRTRPATSSSSGRATGAGRQRLRGLRAALRRRRVRRGRRVPRQHLHDRRPVDAVRGLGRGRQLRRGLGQLRPGRERNWASSPSATTPPALPRGSEFQVNTIYDESPATGRPWPRMPPATSSSPGSSAAAGRQRQRRLRPALRRLGRAARGRVPGQHLHDRLADTSRAWPRDASRQLRRGLEERRTRTADDLGRLRTALRRRGPAAWGGVPGQYVHDERPGRTRRSPRTPAGSFVVAWRSYGQDGSGFGVFARRYDASGSAARARVPGQHAHEQRPEYRPSVASDAAGNFVVAWDELAARTGASSASSASASVDPARGAAGRLRRPAPTATAFSSRTSRSIVRPSWRNVNGAAQTLRRHGLGFDGPPASGRELRAAGRGRQLRHRRQRSDGPVQRLLPGAGGLRRHAAGDALGRDLHGALTPDALGPDEALDAARRRELHGRAEDERLLPLRRDAAAQGRHRRLLGDAPTARRARRHASRCRSSCWWRRRARATRRRPARRRCSATCRRRAPTAASSRSCRGAASWAAAAAATTARGSPVTREQMPVFVLKTLDPALDPPACGRRSSPTCRRRALLPVHRGAGAPRRRERLRWRQLLPGESRHPRADGRLHQRDVRPDALRAVTGARPGRLQGPQEARVSSRRSACTLSGSVTVSLSSRGDER